MGSSFAVDGPGAASRPAVKPCLRQVRYRPMVFSSPGGPSAGAARLTWRERAPRPTRPRNTPSREHSGVCARPERKSLH